MADVGRERGQLILVTGLLVAVAMVVLVLLLNTAIFAENLASRGADPSGSEAIEFRGAVVDGVGELIDAENRQEYATQGSLESAVLLGIDRFDDQVSRYYAPRVESVRINESTLDVTPGALIRQRDPSRRFLNATGTADWRLASGVDGTRGFVLTVDASQLVSSTAGTAQADGAFTIRVSNGGDVWRTFVYEEGGDVVVAQRVGTDPAAEVCRVDAAQATIDVTAGTIEGERCSGLEWADGVSPGYDVEYVDGENATGTYDLTVDTSGAGSVDGNNLNATPPDGPYAVPAVYDVTVEVSYRSPTLRYRTDVRIAPGVPE